MWGGKKSEQQQELEINWSLYNYPPLLRIYHYDINELQHGLRRNCVNSFHRAFKVLVLYLVLNCESTLALALFLCVCPFICFRSKLNRVNAI